jgi:hypothetical protein
MSRELGLMVLSAEYLLEVVICRTLKLSQLQAVTDLEEI